MEKDGARYAHDGREIGREGGGVKRKILANETNKVFGSLPTCVVGQCLSLSILLLERERDGGMGVQGGRKKKYWKFAASPSPGSSEHVAVARPDRMVRNKWGGDPDEPASNMTRSTPTASP
jgi:hypothetical protein